MSTPRHSGSDKKKAGANPPRKLRVLEISPYGPHHLGGLERVVHVLAEKLIDHDIDVEWCCSDTNLIQDIPHVRYTPMKTWNAIERWTGMTYPLWSVGSLLRLRKSILNNDIIHLHDFVTLGCFLSFAIAKIYRKPVMLTMHGPITGTSHVPALSFAFNAYKLLLAAIVIRRANSVTTVGSVAVPKLDRYRNDYRVISNGVNHTTFRSVDDTARERLRRDKGWNVPIVLYVGRLVQEKRLSIIRSLAERCPSARWVLVGGGDLDPRSWGLDNVEKVDTVTDRRELATYYQAADYFILPSKREGLALASIEALASGLPVIVSRELFTPSDPLGAGCMFVDDRTAKDVEATWYETARDALKPTTMRSMRGKALSIDPAMFTWSNKTAEYAEMLRHTISAA